MDVPAALMRATGSATRSLVAGDHGQGALCTSTKMTTTQAAAIVKLSGATNRFMALTFRW